MATLIDFLFLYGVVKYLDYIMANKKNSSTGTIDFHKLLLRQTFHLQNRSLYTGKGNLGLDPEYEVPA